MTTRVPLGCVAAALLAALGCGTRSETPAGTTTTTSSTTTTVASTSPITTSGGETNPPGSSGGPSATTSSSTTGVATTTTGDSGGPECTKNVVVTGYWPPTNEMLRPWSTNPAQRPMGEDWMGANWEGLGYDVYAFFPEFPPDGDPTNDAIGDEGAVGSPRSDLRVDYQDTSADFWRIVDTYQPVMLLTTSRGGDIGWEIEAIDGGHGVGNAGGPETDWTPDGYGPDVLPTEATIDARSWDAITTYRQGETLASTLPVDAIVAAAGALRLTDVVVDQETGGNFLSGFMGLHGLYYAKQTRAVVAAGHIHVGFALPVADAKALIEATLRALLQAHPSERVACPPR